MATPVFAELRMPGLTGPGGGFAVAGQDPAPGAPGDAGGSASPGAVAAGAAGARTAGTAAARPGSWPTRARGIGDLVKSRRGLVLTAPLAATAIVAGIVFLAFPGADKLFKGLTLNPGGTGSVTRSVTSGKQGGAAPGRARRAGTGSGQHRAAARRRRAAAAARAAPSHGSSPAPGQSGHPSPSGQPSPSGSPSGSPTPSPSPSPTSSSPVATGGSLPLGYVWQSVTAGSVGTTAGWRLGAPATWLLTPGVQSYIRPVAGTARLGVNLAPFVAQAPVREARHLQAAAIAHGTYHRYQLISILPRRYHGSAGRDLDIPVEAGRQVRHRRDRDLVHGDDVGRAATLRHLDGSASGTRHLRQPRLRGRAARVLATAVSGAWPPGSGQAPERPSSTSRNSSRAPTRRTATRKWP